MQTFICAGIEVNPLYDGGRRKSSLTRFVRQARLWSSLLSSGFARQKPCGYPTNSHDYTCIGTH